MKEVTITIQAEYVKTELDLTSELQELIKFSRQENLRIVQLFEADDLGHSYKTIKKHLTNKGFDVPSIIEKVIAVGYQELSYLESEELKKFIEANSAVLEDCPRLYRVHFNAVKMEGEKNDR